MNDKKMGVLLVNLGTPDSANPSDVKRYLKQFLSDKHVVDLPYLIRHILLRGFILPIRPKQSAKAYAAIWDPQKGSPLLFHTQALAREVQAMLGGGYDVQVGMRYGHPSIASALEKLAQYCQEVIVIPLFPQYSQAATQSAIEETKRANQKDQLKLFFKQEFYKESFYIQAQASIIQPYLQEGFDQILFSFHSLPVRQIYKLKSACQAACFQEQPCTTIHQKNSNCYRAQCYETSRLLAKELSLQGSDYTVVFQSRLGRTKWIGPEIQTTMQQLYNKGVRRLLIACPSFVTDCLETLEEIGIRAKAYWEQCGGEGFCLVPCLNTDPQWIQTIAQWIKTYHLS